MFSSKINVHGFTLTYLFLVIHLKVMTHTFKWTIGYIFLTTS